MPTRMIRESMHDSTKWVYGCVSAGKQFLAPLPQFNGWAPKALANVLRCCYTACQLKADDFGNFEANPVKLGRWWKVYGVDDDDLEAIEAVTAALASIDFLRSYFVGQKQYLHIPLFGQRMRHLYAACPVPPWQQDEFDAISKKQGLAKTTTDGRQSSDGRTTDERPSDDGQKLEVRSSKSEVPILNQDQNLSSDSTLRASSDDSHASSSQSLENQKAGNEEQTSATPKTHTAPLPAFSLQPQEALAAMRAKLDSLPGKSVRTPSPKVPLAPTCPTQKIVDLYNEHCAKGCGGRAADDGMAKAEPIVNMKKDSRARAIGSRWSKVVAAHPELVTEADGLRYFEEFFKYAGSINWLMGRVSGFVASIDWMFAEDNNFRKIAERGWKNDPAKKSLFNQGAIPGSANLVGGAKVHPDSPWVSKLHKTASSTSPTTANTEA